MKKVCLIINYKNYNRNSFNALLGALETDRTLIENYIDVFFVSNEKEIISVLKKNLDKYEKIVIAFSFFTCYSNQISNTISLINEFRCSILNERSKNKILLIAGGPHPSGDPKGTLDFGIDIVFVGEAEESFLQFLTSLINNEDYRNVRGIAFKEGDGFIFRGKPRKVDLNEYPPFSLRYIKFGPIEITRGCPYGCFYCQTPQLFFGKVRHRDIDIVLNWVKEMRVHRLRDVRYVSPDAFAYGSKDGKEVNTDALETLFSKTYREIKPDGRQFIGTFPSEVRPEHVTEETIQIVKNYGSNKSIIFGAQTGSNRMLKEIHRSHSTEDIYNAVSLCIKNRITPHVDFIFGLPGEEEKDIVETIDMVKQLTQKGAIIHVHRFMPLPQTFFATKKQKKIDERIVKLVGELSRKGLAYGNLNEI